MKFSVDVITADEALSIAVFLGPPSFSASIPGCWACGFGWDGEHAVTREAFGATSLQSVTLAIGLLEISMVSEFPGAIFLEDGRPFLFEPTITTE